MTDTQTSRPSHCSVFAGMWARAAAARTRARHWRPAPCSSSAESSSTGQRSAASRRTCSRRNSTG
eukprot:2734782-Rhodomonas_salina.1